MSVRKRKEVQTLLREGKLMQTKDELKKNVRELDVKLKGVVKSMNVEKLKAEYAELSKQMNEDGFWNNVGNAQKVSQRAKHLDEQIKTAERLTATVRGLEELIEMETDDDGLLSETAAEYDEVKAEISDLYLSALLKGKYDGSNAILSLNAGAGGAEAQDWVSMLYRMYTRYCERRRYKIAELDYLEGDITGIKSVTFLVQGKNAYGYLKAEKGVHRLVRISPFDANKRRHTSFASLDVMPEIESDTDIVIEDKDLKVDTYRSSGAGGQHVNKTESAIRITHLPTGVVVACQNERSQLLNRDRAMKMLKSKLIELKEREQIEEVSAIKGDVKKIEWGSQIRSYVFCPYTMVKDHRTAYETADIDEIMDGDIQPFIEDYLQKTA
jgi:peptide chain release factor 2